MERLEHRLPVWAKRLWTEVLLFRANRVHQKARGLTNRADALSKHGTAIGKRAVRLGSATGNFE